MNYQCDNCGHVGSGDTFPDARDLSQRLDEGGTYTTKECPECGALAYPHESSDRRTADRIDGYDRDNLGESPDY